MHMSNTDQKTEKIQFKQDETLVAIGEVYYRGIGRSRDFNQAFRYYRKAADMGNVSALRRLGTCYERGQGTARDLEAALVCYEDASDRGDALATLKLGDFYKDGLKSLITKDIHKAASYYFAALQQAKHNMDIWGAPDIYLRVADCMLNGVGMNKDVETAYDFYNAAANLYIDRLDSGDSESEELLERAEQGAEICSKILGYKQEVSPEGFEA